MPDIIMHVWDPKTQEETIDLEMPQSRMAIGVLGDSDYADKVLLTPDAVTQLVESGVAVLMERGAGKGIYSDIDYANAGADIMGVTAELLKNVNLVLKLSVLTTEQLQCLKPNTVVMSSVNLAQMSDDDLPIIQQNHLTLIALDLLKDRHGHFVFATILHGDLFGKPAAMALSTCLLPSLTAILSSKNIRYAIQTYPALLQGVYCFQGVVCHHNIAERFQCPWKDILTLCWDWN
ncbi:MAG: hypothetical protein IJU33_10815 [Bacteroidales bacterium]|nr:hypothetical protein [Bacteroidales bacterium]